MFNFKFIPYLDIVREQSENVKLATRMLSTMRKKITSKMYDNRSDIIRMSDSAFWEKNAGLTVFKGIDLKVREQVTERIGGNDTLTDEILNRLYILIKPKSTDVGGESKTIRMSKSNDDDFVETNASRDRRTIIQRDYVLLDRMSNIIGLPVGYDDVVHMKEVSPTEWLEEMIDKSKSPGDVLDNGSRKNIFTPKELYKILKEFNLFKDSSGAVDKEKFEKDASAYDFFNGFLGVSPMMQSKIYDDCRSKFSGVYWVNELGNNKNLQGDENVSGYISSLKEKGFGNLSLDIVGFKDTENGRNFVTVEYQGDQHYRPVQTEGYSIDVLYGDLDGEGEEYEFMWNKYWDNIDAIVKSAKMVQFQKNGNYRTTKKELFKNCVRVLESAQSGNDSGLGDIGKSIGWYKADFASHSDSSYRPKFTDKVKTNTPGFVNSYFRWYCEMDTVVQASSDIVKFLKTVNQDSGIFSNDKNPVFKNSYFFVCPPDRTRVTKEIISNAMHSPYNTNFYGGDGLSKRTKEEARQHINTIKNMYEHTYRANSKKSIDISKCVSIMDETKTLESAIAESVE